MSKIKGFISETMIYGFGNAFSRLFAMLLIPLYAKYLGKVDYSNLVMIQSTFTILTFLLALNAGIFFYYYEYDNLRYRRIVLTSWFYYQLGMLLLIISALIIFSSKISTFFILTETNTDIINWCLILVGIQLLPYIFNITNLNYFRIERKPKKAISIVLLEAMLTVIFVYLSLAVLDKGLIYVLVSQILARTIVAIVFLNKARIYVKFKYFSKKLLLKIIKYTWPFIISSIFTWVIISIDKFIGASKLTDKTEVALLALAMQLVLPISVLSDMIRMALGPYVMSIRKDKDANKSYQQIFELSVYAGAGVTIGLILLSPLLVYVLADFSYIKVIYVIPLMGIAKIISIASTQFSISFNLKKKNTFILYSVIIGGIIGVLTNYLLMSKYGFIISGYSQIASYICMAVFLFYCGKKYADLKIKLHNSLIIVLITFIYIVSLHYINPLLENQSYIIFVGVSCLTLLLISIIYLKQQKIRFFDLWITLKKRIKI